ncbi:MAG: InlB B-repeat-containing protein [Hominenteromicrobium sp.]|uniref:InlB B-repeat-containing protein n=1 Tax=Hominenteromicrobium sp. TaxID=3073581 RepID=UPI003992587A
MGTYNGEVGTLVGGVAKVKGTDTVAPGTFSFKNTPPFYLRTPGEHDVTVVFTPDDLRLHKPTEITIKINAIKNTISNIDEPDPITDKPFGTPFAELGLPENVCINAVDGAWRWIDVAWDESSYDAESVDWQTIIGTPVLSEDDGDIFQQPEPAVTAAIRVKLIDNRPPMPPTIVAESLPDGMEGEAYSNRLTAKGTAPITWSIVSGILPEGLRLNEDTGEISGTPAGEGTEVFTVMAVNDLGEDIKELSITIVKAPEAEYAVTVRDDGHGTGSADPASATAGTEITLTATPNAGYHFKEWQVMSGDVTVKNDKFTMPGSDVEVKAIFEKNAPPTPTEYTVTVKTDGNGTASASHAKAVVGTEITLTATPNAGYHFKEWQVMSGDVTVRDDKFTMPGSDVEVKAIFEEDAPPTPTEYTVTFDGNDGTPSVGSMTTTKQKLTSLPDASRSKHSFNGWYTEKSGGTKITTDTVFSANTTVYAHWTHTGDNNPPVNYYTLRFETGGGSAIPGVRETYNTYMDLTKYVPTRHGYTFVGWYSEQSLVNKVSNIYLTGDRTVYAGWRAVTIPQTGDSGQMNLWSTALCASFAGCVALIVWKIRRREKKSL